MQVEDVVAVEAKESSSDDRSKGETDDFSGEETESEEVGGGRGLIGLGGCATTCLLVEDRYAPTYPSIGWWLGSLAITTTYGSD